MFRNSLVALIGTTALLACGGPDVGSLLDSLETELTNQAEVFCECYVEFGYPSHEMCIAAVTEDDGVALGDRACVVEALEEDADASSAFLECVLDAERELTNCGETFLVCADEGTLNVCIGTYNTAISACPTLPSAVDEALFACGQPATMRVMLSEVEGSASR